MRDVASRTARGVRDHMEDFVKVVQPFGGDGLYAAVFDGHGGSAVARLAMDLFPPMLAERMESQPASDALRSAFRDFDAEVAGEKTGAVAVVSFLQDGILFVANVGDCHALLVSERGQEIVTREHRLADREEYERVIAAGARVWGPYMCLPDGRGVMTTRALGDAPFKRIGQLSEPAVSSRKLGPEDRWLVLASDGVWDPLAAEDVAAIVRKEASAEEAADRLIDEALEVSGDNVSVVVIRL